MIEIEQEVNEFFEEGLGPAINEREIENLAIHPDNSPTFKRVEMEDLKNSLSDEVREIFEILLSAQSEIFNLFADKNGNITKKSLNKTLHSFGVSFFFRHIIISELYALHRKINNSFFNTGSIFML